MTDAVTTTDRTPTTAVPTTRAGRDIRHIDPPVGELLDRYVAALERFDVETLVTLLHPEATMTLQPGRLRLHGRLDICRWLLEEGTDWHRVRLVPAPAGGSPAFGVYRPTAGRHGPDEPFALQVIEVSAGRVSAIHGFVDPHLFPLFDLAPQSPRLR